MVSDDFLDFDQSKSAYSLDEVCGLCRISVELVIELVEYGVIEPEGRAATEWRFPADVIARTQRAERLRRDLELNLPGLALALELLDEIESLHQEVALLRGQLRQLRGGH